MIVWAWMDYDEFRTLYFEKNEIVRVFRRASMLPKHATRIVKVQIRVEE